jgi:hypothetical protein
MTDLRDRARDEADLRQRLTDLAATITTDTTFDHLQTRIATTPPSRATRRTLFPRRVRIAAAAAAVALAAAALLAARNRGDDSVVDTGDTTTSTSRPGDTSTTTLTGTTLPGSAVPEPSAALDGAGAATGTSGGAGTTAGSPQGSGPRSSSATPASGPTSPTSTARLGSTTPLGPIPEGASPDGNPVAVTYGSGGFNPTITYHQDGANTVIDTWVNLGPDGVLHLDTLVVPPRGSQNCLILGTTSAPYSNILGPARIIGGVVTSRATAVSVTATSSASAFISYDEIAPGLHAVLVLLDDDAFRADAVTGSTVLASVNESDRDAFPASC